MKKNFLKIFIFIMIIFLSPKVFAQDFNVSTSDVTSPQGGGRTGTYTGTEIYNTGISSVYNIGTRYNGQLSRIVFNLASGGYADPDGFEKGHTYTLSMNMATDDWRNRFGRVSVKCEGSSGTELSNGNVTYISYRQIKFSFTAPSDRFCQFVYVDLKSTSVSSTAFTGVSNWNLSSMVISDPYYNDSSGGSGGSGGSSNQDIIDSNNQNTQDIINNQNNNTQDIIDNNNSNTQDITDKIDDTFNNCRPSRNIAPLTWAQDYVDRVNNSGLAYITTINDKQTLAYYSYTGYGNYDNTYIYKTDFEPGSYYITFNLKSTTVCPNIGIYYTDGSVHDFPCNLTADTSRHFDFISDSTKTIKYIAPVFQDGQSFITIDTFMVARSGSIISYERPGEICVSKLDEQTTAINDINNSINNDNIDSGLGSDFFSDFQDNNHGLTAIITAPLNAINSIATSSCQALSIPIPFTNSNVSLPCMSEIYEQNIPTVYNIWKVVSFGIIAYFICIDIFHIVKGFKDPESDKVEVLDL